MSNQHPADPKLLDKRVIDRYLARGSLQRADVDAHLSGLADVEENSENIAHLVYGSEAESDVAAAGDEAAEAQAPVEHQAVSEG